MTQIHTYTATANILPHMAEISCKTLILLSLSSSPLSLFLHFAVSQRFLSSLSAKVAAMFGLLEG